MDSAGIWGCDVLRAVLTAKGKLCSACEMVPSVLLLFCFPTPDQPSYIIVPRIWDVYWIALGLVLVLNEIIDIIKEQLVEAHIILIEFL